MSVWKKALIATTGLAVVLGVSSPAAAQVYLSIGSGYGYGGYAQNYGYGYPQNYGYGGFGQNYGFGMDPRVAVDICSRTVEGNYGVRVTGIRSAGPRNNGAVRVDGYVADYRGYGSANMTFSCKVDRYGGIIDLRVDRNPYYGGW